MSQLIMATVLFLFSFGAFASPYAGLSLGRVKYMSNDAPNMPDDIAGGQLALHGGYKFAFLAAEAFVKGSRAKGSYMNGNNQNVDVNINNRISGLGGRFYFPPPIGILNFKGGVAWHKKDVDLKINGVITQSPLDGKERGLYAGFGGRFPLPVIDIFADITYYHLDLSGIVDLDVGVRYYF